jgi:four helix bundle protein
MSEEETKKPYDLEERTYLFAKCVRQLVKRLPRTVTNLEDIKQLVKVSGSVGANYIEANESLGKKDFVMRLKISRKEAKESIYWLRLVDTGDETTPIEKERAMVIAEATEPMQIFGAIIPKSE